jgi:hypothetical protein
MAKYTNFYDESRPLKPIAPSIAWASNDFLHESKDSNNDNEQNPHIPKLHRFARIPPIISASSTSST